MRGEVELQNRKSYKTFFNTIRVNSFETSVVNLRLKEPFFVHLTQYVFELFRLYDLPVSSRPLRVPDWY